MFRGPDPGSHLEILGSLILDPGVLSVDIPGPRSHFSNILCLFRHMAKRTLHKFLGTLHK